MKGGEMLNSELSQATAVSIRLIIQYLYERVEMLNSELSQATAAAIIRLIQFLDVILLQYGSNLKQGEKKARTI